MIDTEALNEQADLLGIACMATPLVKLTEFEYAGPCPKCGGTDRFHVNRAMGWWFCRNCYAYDNGQPHDAIALVGWLGDMTFREACEFMAPGSAAVVPMEYAKRLPAATLPQTETPADTWQETAESFVSYAEKKLWETPEAVVYLVSRGLSEATIKAARLGYNPKTIFDRDLARWGKEDGKAVWLPAGWTIPCWLDGQLQYVKVRRPEAELRSVREWNDAHPKAKRRPDDKYVAIWGSKKRGVLYGLDDLPSCEDLIICEGEYDAMLLCQELGNIAGVVATGAARAMPGAGAMRALVRFRRHWTALDTDAAGQGGAEHWGEISSRARPLPPTDHDVTDAWKAGHDLVRWAIAGIGPQDPDRRKAWLYERLDECDQAAFDAGIDDTDPALRRWMALYAELSRLEGWNGPDMPSTSDAAGFSLEKGYIDVPLNGAETRKSAQAEAVTVKTSDYLVRLAKQCGGEWHEIPAPELDAQYAWCAEGHRFYESDSGEIVSVSKH